MKSNHEPLQVLVFAKSLSDEIYALTRSPIFGGLPPLSLNLNGLLYL